ncbi:MAG TPA: hypothetical protein PK366_08845 [Fibrobacteraceae bacterium]|nr:hypothetical protein [Fibrobacteraceae bacterium]
MTQENQKDESLASIVFENLKELLKAKNAAHESMFKFHWKKLPPFNLIWPQVDFLRIIRLMGEIEKHAEEQKVFIKKNLSKATEKELPFFKAIPDYLDALVVSCRALTEIAQFKQDKLEKKEGRSVFSFSKLLKSYENAQDQLVRKGAFVQVHWMELN